eukprot:Phypoly_transcript_22151.p1 GENE.Phypoly_transcript_22151~~Phypoly_transcript_22151.p1  ORF type:complete len:106 (+),score=2.79 Phypoly_transcript_22151:67-384(+)
MLLLCDVRCADLNVCLAKTGESSRASKFTFECYFYLWFDHEHNELAFLRSLLAIVDGGVTCLVENFKPLTWPEDTEHTQKPQRLTLRTSIALLLVSASFYPTSTC